MTHILKNLSRRPVSFRGNSGQTWHVAPSAVVELPDFEVSENPMLHKLAERHVVELTRSEKKERAAADEDKKERDAAEDDKGRGRKSRSGR